MAAADVNFSSGHNKVPQVAIAFWIIKIAATTVGETGGDAVSMTLDLGYAISTVLFFGFFVVALAAQLRAKSFRPFLYWTVVVATTTAGTTAADFADRSLGIGYIGGVAILFALVLAILGLWRWTMGSVAVDRIASPKVEIFYWATILASNTLGTALGDFLASRPDVGYERGALVFSALLAVVLAAYLLTGLSRALLFWAAFILTRPLGATVGDLLTKPHADGGLELSRIGSSVTILVVMIACVVLLPQRAAGHPQGTAGR